jgi:hypothetical protein
MSSAPKDRNRCVEDYVLGAADEDAARQMEIEMLEDDELFERVQNEELIRRGFESTEQVGSASRSQGSGNSAAHPRLPWALAASFGAAALLLGLYSLQLNERIETLQSPTTGLKVITLFEQRNLVPDTTDPTAQLAGHEGPVFLEIDVSAYKHESFQLEIVRGEGSLTWEDQVPDHRGYLNILIPEAHLLQEIRLRTRRNELIQTYSLREN